MDLYTAYAHVGAPVYALSTHMLTHMPVHVLIHMSVRSPKHMRMCVQASRLVCEAESSAVERAAALDAYRGPSGGSDGGYRGGEGYRNGAPGDAATPANPAAPATAVGPRLRPGPPQPAALQQQPAPGGDGRTAGNSGYGGPPGGGSSTEPQAAQQSQLSAQPSFLQSVAAPTGGGPAPPGWGSAPARSAPPNASLPAGQASHLSPPRTLSRAGTVGGALDRQRRMSSSNWGARPDFLFLSLPLEIWYHVWMFAASAKKAAQAPKEHDAF